MRKSFKILSALWFLFDCTSNLLSIDLKRLSFKMLQIGNDFVKVGGLRHHLQSDWPRHFQDLMRKSFRMPPILDLGPFRRVQPSVRNIDFDAKGKFGRPRGSRKHTFGTRGNPEGTWFGGPKCTEISRVAIFQFCECDLFIPYLLTSIYNVPQSSLVTPLILFLNVSCPNFWNILFL